MRSVPSLRSPASNEHPREHACAAELVSATNDSEPLVLAAAVIEGRLLNNTVLFRAECDLYASRVKIARHAKHPPKPTKLSAAIDSESPSITENSHSPEQTMRDKNTTSILSVLVREKDTNLAFVQSLSRALFDSGTAACVNFVAKPMAKYPLKYIEALITFAQFSFSKSQSLRRGRVSEESDE